MGARVCCPSCLDAFTADEADIGREGNCPLCGHIFVLKSVGKAPEEKAASPLTSSGNKSCPYCAETILAAARKCKYCGEFLDGGMLPQARVDRLHVFENRVRLRIGSELPGHRCLLCGSTSGVERIPKTFYYTPPWCWILFFVAGIIGLIVMMALRKQAQVGIPMCPECRSGWTWATALLYTYVIIGIFALPALFGVIGQAIDPRGDLLGLGIVLGFLLWIIGAVLVRYGWVSKKQATCTMIDETHIDLKFARMDLVRGTQLKGR